MVLCFHVSFFFVLCFHKHCFDAFHFCWHANNKYFSSEIYWKFIQQLLASCNSGKSITVPINQQFQLPVAQCSWPPLNAVHLSTYANCKLKVMTPHRNKLFAWVNIYKTCRITTYVFAHPSSYLDQTRPWPPWHKNK